MALRMLWVLHRWEGTMLRTKTRRHHHHEHAGCSKHPLEPAMATCSSCDRACCGRCSLDLRRRVLCIDCGLTKAGVRAPRR